eukprot:3623712-Amphidinium_carterae.1
MLLIIADAPHLLLLNDFMLCLHVCSQTIQGPGGLVAATGGPPQGRARKYQMLHDGLNTIDLGSLKLGSVLSCARCNRLPLGPEFDIGGLQFELQGGWPPPPSSATEVIHMTLVFTMCKH